jgi:hypothetical protein
LLSVELRELSPCRSCFWHEELKLFPIFLKPCMLGPSI